MIRLCFITRALTAGGSERQLVELVGGLDKERFEITVLAFYGGGALWHEVAALPGVRVISLEKRGRWDLLGFGWRAWRAVARLQPHLVHGYLGTANELALLLGRLAGARVAWRLGAAWMDLGLYDWTWRTAFRLGRRLSRFADVVIVNSRASLEHHRAEGWAVGRMVVIANGFDLDRFKPDLAAGRAARACWGVPDGVPLIGIVARLDPIKDHPTFLRAAALYARRDPAARFVCVGGGPADYARRLRDLAQALGLADVVTWAGETADMPGAYNACDLVTLCSTGESLPNAIGEAMACGVPCVATRVGDVEDLMGDTGWLVAPGDPAALAEGWTRLLTAGVDRRALGRRARARIAEWYDKAEYVRRTAELLQRLAGEGRPVMSAAAPGPGRS